MLPENFRSSTPIVFVYWEKVARMNLGLAFNNEFNPFFILTSEAIPEPFAVGLN